MRVPSLNIAGWSKKSLSEAGSKARVEAELVFAGENTNFPSIDTSPMSRKDAIENLKKATGEFVFITDQQSNQQSDQQSDQQSEALVISVKPIPAPFLSEQGINTLQDNSNLNNFERKPTVGQLRQIFESKNLKQSTQRSDVFSRSAGIESSFSSSADIQSVNEKSVDDRLSQDSTDQNGDGSPRNNGLGTELPVDKIHMQINDNQVPRTGRSSGGKTSTTDDSKKSQPAGTKPRKDSASSANGEIRRRVTWGKDQSYLPEYSTDSSLLSSRSPSPVNGSSLDLSTLKPITEDTSNKIAGDVANGALNQPFEDLDPSRPKPMEVESTTQTQTQTEYFDEIFDEISAESGGGLQGAVDVAQGPLTLQQKFRQIDENLKGTTPDEIRQKAKELVSKEKKTEDYKRGLLLSMQKELLSQPSEISVESTKIENNKTQSNDSKTQKGYEVGIFDSHNKQFTFKTLEGKNIVVAESELVNILTNASNNPSNPAQKGQYYGLYFHDNERGQLTYSALPFSNQELGQNGFRTLSKQEGPRFLFSDSNDLSKPILVDAEIQMQQVSQQQAINHFGAVRTRVAMLNGMSPRVVDKIDMFNGMSPRVVDGGVVSSPEATHIKPKELFR